MSLRVPLAAAAAAAAPNIDSSKLLQHEDDLSLSRASTRTMQSARSVAMDPSSSTALRVESGSSAHGGQTAVLELSPAVTPSPQRRMVLPDPVAFRFLEADPSVTVIERQHVLRGYELYLIEQWACSRNSPTLVIVAYTGDPKDSVVVGVLGIPADEKQWSPSLRVYSKAIQQCYARPKETEIGELMVTNLSSFPSALTLIPIPDGDIRKHYQVFVVNEDLKRLGCSGRSGMSLAEPTPATQARFMQIYKVSDRIPFSQAVLELVKLCQQALFLFNQLEPEYMDGLLCDITESAINNWWAEIGSEYYNIEPTDGILGPTTVAALLGTLMGARNRLNSFGAPISKDVFDVDSTKRAIGVFQKSCKLKRTRRLDRQTLLKLHRVTAKAAAGEGGWGVQKAVKSTVAEIGGKRGELMMGMVGARDKANIGDIETLDLDKFISLAQGERAKWLWHGKAKRTAQDHEHTMADVGNLIFGKEAKEETGSQAASRRAQAISLEEDVEGKKKDDFLAAAYAAPYSASPLGLPSATTLTTESSHGDKDALRRTVFKSVAGKMNDARSGFGRIRDAVGGGLKGHASRPSRDENGSSGSVGGVMSPSIATLAHSSANLSSPVAVGRAFTWKNKPEEYLNTFRGERDTPELARARSVPVDSSETNATPLSDQQRELSRYSEEPSTKFLPRADEKAKLVGSQAMEIRKEIMVNDSSIAGSVVDEGDLQGPILEAERLGGPPLSSLQRRHSISLPSLAQEQPPNINRYPRHLSFSDAEDAVLRWVEIVDTFDPTEETAAGPINASELERRLHSGLMQLQNIVRPWATGKVMEVATLNESFAQQHADLQNLYWALSEAYGRIRHSSGEQLGEERAHLAEAVKDIETLVAKLEYEIDALAGRVQDVEDGVAQFAVQVAEIEKRADELQAVLETESWLHWFVRTLTGIGTGPNITRGAGVVATTSTTTTTAEREQR